MQGHASAIVQRDELTDREALGTRVGAAPRLEITDGANAYDAARPDTRQILVRFSCARVWAKTALRTTHVRVCLTRTDEATASNRPKATARLDQRGLPCAVLPSVILNEGSGLFTPHMADQYSEMVLKRHPEQ
jgi:hypothetical protein